MTEAAAAHTPLSRPIATPTDEAGPVVVDGEALLPGARGRIGVTVSVRLQETMEIWLYAAEIVRERPARGLWRWRRTGWERLSGSTDLDPLRLVHSLTDRNCWVKPQAAAQRDAVIALLRSALAL